MRLLLNVYILHNGTFCTFTERLFSIQVQLVSFLNTFSTTWFWKQLPSVDVKAVTTSAENGFLNYSFIRILYIHIQVEYRYIKNLIIYTTHPNGSVPGQTLILLLSFRRHDIFGIGLPIALHVNVTRIPSVARVSELLESSNISGGTTC